jgi:cytosine/adenosine deaminase-related metal-dependent hydrolase
MIRTIHNAKFVLPESGLILRNAAVHVSDPGRITRLEPCQSQHPNKDAEVIDWGAAIILPGLVNAHTHLELTRLPKQPAPESFTGWLKGLMACRQNWTREQYAESARAGAHLSLEAGVTLAGDISASGFSSQAIKTEKLRKVVFEEVASFLPEKKDEVLTALERRLAQTESDQLLSISVSPHAPYSTSPVLYQAVAQTARQRGARLATHVAETPGEIEFLERGTGEFAAMLRELGVMPAAWQAPGMPPIAYLESMGILDRPALLIHCNYLDDASIASISAHGCSVAFCSRSHAYFGFDPHPVRRLLDAGINVALGTDSLASNDSLSILEEMRFLFRQRKDLKCEEIFRMATLNGAVALEFGGVLGRLRRGFWADMTILSLPDDITERNLLPQILEGAGECLATIVQGEIVWARDRIRTERHPPCGT